MNAFSCAHRVALQSLSVGPAPLPLGLLFLLFLLEENLLGVDWIDVAGNGASAPNKRVHISQNSQSMYRGAFF